MYDVLIIGGGMVGASLACALAGQPLRVGLVEAVPLDEPAQPSYDDRVVALSLGSKRILEAMGLWSADAPGACPIQHIHVSDRGHFGKTRLSAREEGVEALGYVVAARDLGPVLGRCLAGMTNLDLLCPARMLGIDFDGAAVEVEIDAEGEARTVQSRLVVAADGGRSLVRQAAGIATRERDYGQSAVIANVTPGLPHGNVAFERFTDSGPMALLPMQGNRCSLVWTTTTEQVEDLLGLDDAAFLQRLQARFGQRLGRFRQAGRRVAYPLGLIRAREQVRPRLVVIGNAAHTVHPMAGQGFNLGLRDVAVLAQVLVDAVRAGGDPGDPRVLDAYARWRRGDQRQVTVFTDTVVRVFSNRFAPLALARNLGLLGTDLLPPLKHALARRAMGLAGRQPRLARGLPL